MFIQRSKLKQNILDTIYIIVFVFLFFILNIEQNIISLSVGAATELYIRHGNLRFLNCLLKFKKTINIQIK